MIMWYRRLFHRSVTWTVPIIAHAAILWGLVFVFMGPNRRGTGGLRTTNDFLPAWAWGTLMIAGGLGVLGFVRPWAVALLAGVMSLYVFTLLANVLRYDNVSWTAPIWPLTTTAVLIVASSRLGVRRPHHDRR